MRLDEAWEPLGEDESWAHRLRAGEAADRDSQLNGQARTGQDGQPTGISAVDVAGLGTAERASDHRRGDRQLDGQIIHIQSAINEEALLGSREEFEGDQEGIHGCTSRWRHMATRYSLCVHRSSKVQENPENVKKLGKTGTTFLDFIASSRDDRRTSRRCLGLTTPDVPPG